MDDARARNVYYGAGICVVPERKEEIEEYLGMVREQRKHLKRTI